MYWCFGRNTWPSCGIFKDVRYTWFTRIMVAGMRGQTVHIDYYLMARRKKSKQKYTYLTGRPVIGTAKSLFHLTNSFDNRTVSITRRFVRY